MGRVGLRERERKEDGGGRAFMTLMIRLFSFFFSDFIIYFLFARLTFSIAVVVRTRP